MKLLCICPIGIGNYLLFYPACKLLKKYRPDAQLHLLALRKPIAELAAPDPLWDKIHLIDPTKEKNKVKTIKFINSLRKEAYDVSLSFFPSNTWQYNLFPFLCAIPERYNFNYPLKQMQSLSVLNTDKLNIDPELHDVIQNVKLAAHFLDNNLSGDDICFPELYSDHEIEQTKKILGEGAPAYMAIHPGSSVEHGMDAKRWAPERFGLLADRICGTLGVKALIFGGPDELQIKKQVASVMNENCQIIEPQNLRLTAALMKQCALCLCNDSGLMHIAACVGIPVAAVFGPTDEKRNGPWGQGHLILRKEMKGFPLWTAKTVGSRAVPKGVDPMESINALSVDDAWEMVRPWLKKIQS